jgi:archaellum biogenesis ATPase FlaH
MENKLLKMALAYHDKGFSVLALTPKNKMPIMSEWQKYCAIRSTREEIEAWWTTTPNANIGIACGPANSRFLFVVDQDVLKDENKKPILNEDGSFKQKGDISGCPPTVTQTSGSGGKQLFYWAPKGYEVKNYGGIRHLVDIRGIGGQVVVPPSIHPNGNEYAWDIEDLDPSNIIEFPKELLDKFLGDREKNRLSISTVLAGLPVGEGLRHIGMAQVAGFYLQNAKTQSEIEMARIALYAWDKDMNKSPEKFEERKKELDNTIEGILKLKLIGNTEKMRSAFQGRGAVLACFADIKPEPINWLWPEKIALGKLTLIAGDPGLGKSLISVAIAAAISKEYLWPIDNTRAPLGDVVFISAEDDPADTVRPRLDAAGADCSRIHILKAVQCVETDADGKLTQRMFSLKNDIPILEKVMADLPNCKLIVVDPISAYMDGTESHANADVRGLLAPLAELAARYKVAVIAISHLNKNNNGNAMYRTMGSLAFIAAARAAFLVTKDKDTLGRVLVLPIKNNIAKVKTGLAYTVAEADNGAPVMMWDSKPVEMTADDALSIRESNEEKGDTDWAVDFLEDLLRDGPVSAEVGLKESKKAGINRGPLGRAQKKLGIKPKKLSFSGGWYWSLPTIEGVQGIQDTTPEIDGILDNIGDLGSQNIVEDF